MDTAMFDRTVKTTHGIVAGISRDQLEAATPCPEWTVRDLLNHMIGSYEAVASGGAGEPLDPSGIDYTAEDYVAAFESATSKAGAAFSAPGALEKPFAMPWGETQGEALLGLVVTETVVHGWDLAQATSQEIPVDDVAEWIYQMSTGMMEPQGNFPRGTNFGPPVDVPDDAPVQDKMLAYFGRQP